MQNEIERMHDVFLHAETVGQTRLNNFLMTGTILLIGSAVSLAIEQPKVVGPAVSLVLATLGVMFSRAWYYLGRRQRMYHHFVEYMLNSIAREGVAQEASAGSARAIRNLQYFHSHVVRKPFEVSGEKSSKSDVRYPEQRFSSRKLLTTVPRYFAVAYVAVWIISFAVLAWQVKCFPEQLYGVSLFYLGLHLFGIVCLTAIWCFWDDARIMGKEITSEQIDEHIKVALRCVDFHS